jgi:uncharacterized protein (DUF1800 family)
MKMPIRRNALVACLVLAIAGAAPAASAADEAARSPMLGPADARHLLARTGFGPTAAEVRAFAAMTRAEAVDLLLREARTVAVTPPPASMTDALPLVRPGPQASVEERQAFDRGQARETQEVRAWWVQEMLRTPSPLTERMTLFWHNHFVSSQPKVRVARLMYAQNVTLRAHALGNFGTLLHAIAKDPAMLVYLDGVQSRRGQPNENFAREVMELFTLGEGRYTERDVKEAARAFTGWSVDRDRGTFVARPSLHDAGEKTVLGHTGRFDGDAVLDLLLAEPATASHLARKLWREFVSTDPDADGVKRVANALRASNYEIGAALRELLACDAFYAASSRAVLVKSPAELVVGTLRQLEIEPPDALPLAAAAAAMGQSLLAPPNVKGWPGATTWINSHTLMVRKQFLERVARVEAGVDAAAWVARQPGRTPAEKRAAAARLLVPLDVPAADADDVSAPALLRTLLLDPAYELK